MKKHVSRILLPLLTATLLCVLFVVTVSAVPPVPGSGAEQGACPSHPGEPVRLSDLPNKAGTGIPRCAAAPAAPQKELPLAVIVMEFPNMPYHEDFDWYDTIFQDKDSLRQYYLDQSYGQFTFAPVAETSQYDGETNRNTADRPNDGVVHVTLTAEHDDWTLNEQETREEEFRHNHSMGVAFIEAIEKAGAYVDFSAYDADGNGKIENDELAVAFVVAGYEASAAWGQYEPYGAERFLWSHAWDLASLIGYYQFSDLSVPAPDDTYVSSYISIAENLDTDEQEPISVLAHELGHYLGLPDLYDTDYLTGQEWSLYDVSDFSVMCAGSWGVDLETNTYRPYSFDVWSKVFLEWITPTDGENNTAYSLSGSDDHPEALRIFTPVESETYLVENRRFTGWDAGLARTFGEGGLILWHIDEKTYAENEEVNKVNNTDHHPAVMPLYPEQFSDGTVSFIGEPDTVLLRKAVFSASAWNELCAPYLGSSLDLPLYAEDGEEDLRRNRRLSGVHVTFTSDSADVMTLNIGTPGHMHELAFVPEAAPNCGTPGVKAHYLCAGCGRRFFDAEGKTEATDLTLSIAPTGDHTWDGGRVTTAPNCGNAGEKTYTCAVCKQTRVEELPPVGEHKWNNGVLNPAPTCVDEGTRVFACTVCGTTRSETVAPTGVHTWSAWMTEKKPSCYEQGVNVRICTVCKAEERADVPMTAHDWDGGVLDPAPRCETSGSLRVTCRVCGDYYRETLEPLGHEWSAWKVDFAPTATNPGQESRLCARCLNEETRPIPPTGDDPTPDDPTPDDPTPDDPTPDPGFLPGDVDLDGKVTAADARLALRRAVLLETFSEDSLEFRAADVDFDRKATASDARLILRAAVGLETLRRKDD